MTRARDIADLVDANGDIVAGALDNVPPADLVNDTTPQLGGALDAQGNNMTSVGDVTLGGGRTTPATSGGVVLSDTGINNDIVSNGRSAGLLSTWASLRIHPDAAYSALRIVGDTSQSADYMKVVDANGNNVMELDSSGNLSVSGSVGGLVLMNKQTTTIYTTTATTHNVDFSNIPSDGTAKAALVTLYVGSDADHIDWHFGRSTNNSASWQGGDNDPGWSDAWGDILLTWVGNVGGYSWWMGSLVIPVNSNGSFNATCAGASNRGNRLRIAGIGYFK